MKSGVLRGAMMGADKSQTLERIEALNQLIDAVQSGTMFREQALEEAQKIASEPMKKAVGGFREDDVRQYIDEMIKAL